MVDWSNVTENSLNYHTAGPDMESTKKKEKRSSKEHVEKGSPNRHRDDRIHLEAD